MKTIELTDDAKDLLIDLLNALFTDFEMIKDGSWQPDDEVDAAQCSQYSLEEVANILGLKKPVDLRK